MRHRPCYSGLSHRPNCHPRPWLLVVLMDRLTHSPNISRSLCMFWIPSVCCLSNRSALFLRRTPLQLTSTFWFAFFLFLCIWVLSILFTFLNYLACVSLPVFVSSLSMVLAKSIALHVDNWTTTERNWTNAEYMYLCGSVMGKGT